MHIDPYFNGPSTHTVDDMLCLRNVQIFIFMRYFTGFTCCIIDRIAAVDDYPYAEIGDCQGRIRGRGGYSTAEVNF